MERTAVRPISLDMNTSLQATALELLTVLLGVPSPPGREERMAALLCDKIHLLGYDPETDAAGNVLVRLPGCDMSAPSCIFAAHVDEIALVVTRVEDDGRLRVERSGALWPHKIGERMLQIVGDEQTITGVLSVGSAVDCAGDAPWSRAHILTGHSAAQLRVMGIRPGSTAVPIAEGRGPFVFGDPDDPLLGAWTLDDRLGVCVLLLILKSLQEQEIVLPRPTLVAFTVHEEGGAHGAKVLAHRERPEVFCAVDGCAVNETTGLALDGHPVAWSKDGKGHYDQLLIRSLAHAATQAGTQLNTAVLGSGVYSDASAVYDCGAVPRVAAIGHGRENVHGYEVTRLGVIANVHATLLHFMQIEQW
jgi:putative aminopeptidase FrvX